MTPTKCVFKSGERNTVRLQKEFWNIFVIYKSTQQIMQLIASASFAKMLIIRKVAEIHEITAFSPHLTHLTAWKNDLFRGKKCKFFGNRHRSLFAEKNV